MHKKSSALAWGIAVTEAKTEAMNAPDLPRLA